MLISLSSNDITITINNESGTYPTLEKLERIYIQLILEETGGNKTRAARILEMDRRTLYRKIDKI